MSNSGMKVTYSPTVVNGVAQEPVTSKASVTYGATCDMKGYHQVGGVGSFTADVIYRYSMFDNNQTERWNTQVHGLVVNSGLSWMADAFRDGVGAPNWYLLLIDGTTTPVITPGDTMASHAGWAEESADYSQATRPALTLGATTIGSMDNSASLALFSFTGTGTIAGAGITSVNTKGGDTGTLFDAGTFPDNPRPYGNGWQLYLSVTWVIAAA